MYKPQAGFDKFMYTVFVRVAKSIGVMWSLIVPASDLCKKVVYIVPIKSDIDLELSEMNNIKFAGIILDCTKFNGSFQKLVYIIRSEILSTSFSIILNKNNISDINNFPALKNNCFFVEEGIYDFYRENGLHAAYLRALETKFAFSSNISLGLQETWQKIIERKLKFQHILGSFKGLWVLIKWHLGFRDF